MVCCQHPLPLSVNLGFQSPNLSLAGLVPFWRKAPLCISYIGAKLDAKLHIM
uniref:Uncharacterized protein n=1 Tax=Arundo donax TaxID=35708 RepID=A0A0A9EDF1_ARUDO